MFLILTTSLFIVQCDTRRFNSLPYFLLLSFVLCLLCNSLRVGIRLSAFSEPLKKHMVDLNMHLLHNFQQNLVFCPLVS